MPHPGALHAAFVRSPHASALIRGIDTAEASAIPGVIAIYGAKDVLDGGLLDGPAPFRLPQGDGSFAEETPRPHLARERVRFVGEPVVMVIAESAYAALDAAERVSVDYEEEAAVVGVDRALAEDAVQEAFVSAFTLPNLFRRLLGEGERRRAPLRQCLRQIDRAHDVEIEPFRRGRPADGTSERGSGTARS